MSSHRISMGILAALLAGAMNVQPARASASPNPLCAGTWVINLQKTTFTPGPPLKSSTFVMTADRDGRLHERLDTVNAKGEATQLSFDAALDGKPVAVTGSDAIDSVSLIGYNGGSAFKYEFKKGDSVVQWGFFRLDASGDMLYGPMYGNAADGSHWKIAYWFDRRK